jgi:hypothetical protein
VLPARSWSQAIAANQWTKPNINPRKPHLAHKPTKNGENNTSGEDASHRRARGALKRPPIGEDLKVLIYQSQEADNTFITSDGTSPYNSTR